MYCYDQQHRKSPEIVNIIKIGPFFQHFKNLGLENHKIHADHCALKRCVVHITLNDLQSITYKYTSS